MADRFFGKTGAKRFKLAVFLLLSFLFHSLLLLFKVDLTGDSDEDELVSIKYYDDSAFAQSSEKRLEEALPEKKDKDELNKTGQIVDIAKPKVEKKPRKSRFLAEYDSAVEKETTSDSDPNITERGTRLQKKLAENIPQKNVDADIDSPVVSDESDRLNDAEKTLEKFKKGVMKGFDGTDGKLAAGEEKEVAGKLTGEDEIDRTGSTFVGGRRIPKRYLPYFNGTDMALMTPSSDFLEDVKRGNETYLNTKKFLYAAYFNKMKQAVSRNWSPGAVMLINNPGGKIYGREDRFTKLLVHISAKGELVSAKVITSSGADFLDKEAINAFKMAAPFSPPPEILLNEKKLLEIRFGFMVTTSNE